MSNIHKLKQILFQTISAELICGIFWLAPKIPNIKLSISVNYQTNSVGSHKFKMVQPNNTIPQNTRLGYIVFTSYS